MENTIKSQFLLNPEITFLNHGSFGACPIPVFEEYQNWQRKLEKDPVQFFSKTGSVELEKSRNVLGEYLNCDADDLVYVTNPSVAFNIVIKSLKLNLGDEILTTNQEYGAMDKTWDYYCNKTGAKYVHQNISLPLKSKELFLEEFWKGLTSKTKVIFMSQITSPTGLIFPVAEICKKAKELGLLTIIDGAHVPGHIDLDLTDLEADVYTGACHKWLLTPKGSTFLYIRKELQSEFDPLVISWGYNSANPGTSIYQDYHEYQGTRDFTAFLCTSKALAFQKENNWTNISKSCKQMILDNYQEACKILNSSPLCPITKEFLGQMCSIPVNTSDPVFLKEILYEEYKIEVPVPNILTQNYIRFSIQAYNSQSDIEVLFDAIKDIQKKSSLLY